MEYGHSDRLIRLSAVPALLFILLSSTPQVRADGCYFARTDVEVGRSGKLVDSPKQEAILATDGKIVQVILRTHFRPQTRELAWVVPVPAKPTAVEPAWQRVFERLDEAFAPRFYKVTLTSHRPLFKFGCSAASQDVQLAQVEFPVRVEKTGRAGMFDYAVLSATRADELSKWLSANQYHIPPDASSVLQRYVDKGWYWLAMKVRADSADQALHAPHPISYTYRGSELVFPLAISQISAAEENEILLYVVGSQPYQCQNFHKTTLKDRWASDYGGEVYLTPGSRSGTNYEEVVREKTRQAGGHLFVTEFASHESIFGRAKDTTCRLVEVIDGNLVDALGRQQHLTRLRAYLPAQSMDQDVILSPAPDQRPVNNEIRLSESLRPTTQRATQPTAAGMVPLPLLCLTAFLTGRRRFWRLAGRVCLMAALAMLAMM